MPIHTRLALLAAVAAAVVAAPGVAQDKPAAKKLYCWNQNGARVCSDTLPPEAVNQARDEFNVKSGMRSAEVQRAMSSDERAAAAASEQQRQADLAAEQMRKRTDQAMLMSYQSEDDLRRVFNERIAIVDNNIHTARFNVTSLREGLASMLRAAGDRELAGQAVADKLAGNIQQRHRELMAQLRLQGSFEQQRTALDGEITDILQRYRAMKGAQDTATPAG
ncbi:hypothetical protein [Xanthomonas campestris]|uniref:hypothetical protein n=1 Tax=Xanthomonas campestris TaxID=339 RepID=UPI0023652F95|nr:hypothetical protein [Xanthomonas campestris]MEA9784674.1 hypothetical protein [Xanthomonas campestris pv. raphani]MEA9793223.1 hypothetical protein [Xanthomonas campestris pv. raphani]MEA9804843.1 hypothetical protein [Xanthomonas campestris pv. raphani]MEA9820755.1 hypothetical protein [Xanthomonas campestris pv. raphani]MEA9873092.1 hypothetical protein [Xanthomonas campestris pv. raphani]